MCWWVRGAGGGAGGSLETAWFLASAGGAGVGGDPGVGSRGSCPLLGVCPTVGHGCRAPPVSRRCCG
eukprot:259640-Alexandrium_andersonii.AAC.1